MPELNTAGVTAATISDRLTPYKRRRDLRPNRVRFGKPLSDQAGVNTSWGAAVLRGVLAAQQPGANAVPLFFGHNRTFGGEAQAGACGVDLQRGGALDDRHAARAL